MDYQLVPGTVAYIPEIVRVGLRAFENDALEHVIFPDRSDKLLESKEAIDYRMNRIRKRLESPKWRYVLATTESNDGPAKLVGYAGWMAPLAGQKNETKERHASNGIESQKKEAPAVIDFENTPKGMDIDAAKHVDKTLEKAKKEMLGEEHSVWYLASLAVDPDFKGKGIASELVQWGISQAEVAGLPCYLESSPAAVGLYRRLGFKDLRKLSVIRGDESHSLTVMMRRPLSSEAQLNA